MSKFINLFKKDMRELVTLELIIPFLLIVVIYSLVGRIVSSETKKVNAPQDVAVVDYDNSKLSMNFIDLLRKENLIPETLNQNNMQSALEYAKQNKLEVLIEIPKGFESSVLTLKQPEVDIYYIMQSLSVNAKLSQSATVKNVLQAINSSISSQFISSKFNDISPEIIKNPVKSKDFVVIKNKTAEISPEIVAMAFQSQNIFIPIILMFVILYSSQMLASLIANEKQNKTLETLLTVPIERPKIVVSKMLSSGVVALFISVIFLLGMENYLGGISGGQIGGSQYSGVLAKVGLTFTAQSYVLLGLSTFLAILAALAVTTILAAYAEDVKGAQAMLAPLYVLLMIPYLITLIADPNTMSAPIKIFIYAIPFSQPFLAMGNLLFGITMPVIYGILYEIAFSFICVIIAARIFSSDKILTAKVRFGRSIKSK